MAAANFGQTGSAYGLWDGFGTNNAYSYQVLICDHSFSYLDSSFLVTPVVSSGATLDVVIQNPRTSFSTNGHRPVSARLISVGLR